MTRKIVADDEEIEKQIAAYIFIHHFGENEE